MKTFFSEYHCSRGWYNILKQDNSWRNFHANLLAEQQGDITHWWNWVVQKSQVIMLDGKGTDYFITTPELVEMIVGMVRECTADVLDVLAEHRDTAFIIHPPSPLSAVLVGIHTDSNGTVAVFHEKGGKAGNDILLSTMGRLCFSGGKTFKPDTYAEKLAIGLALYTRFFPQAVRDGIPDMAKHPAHYKGVKCRSIGMAEQLVDRRGLVPHIRRCHFRFLSSERFTEKRGTYVLVKESFIRGKCKIVVEAEE